MNEQTIEKLKKILRLANNEAATQGEVEAAMARAKEIAMQHNIDLSMLDYSDPNVKAKSIEVDKINVVFGSSREYPYHRWIAHVIKQVFEVTVINLGRGYAFVGDKNDTAVAKEIFPWLEDVFRSSFRKKVEARELAQCAAHRNGFYRGFTDGLLEVNKRAAKETMAKQGVDSNKYAMVLANKKDAIEKAMPNFFPHLRKARNVRRQDSFDASGIGRQEGRKVNLRQVGGTSARSQLS